MHRGSRSDGVIKQIENGLSWRDDCSVAMVRDYAANTDLTRMLTCFRGIARLQKHIQRRAQFLAAPATVVGRKHFRAAPEAFRPPAATFSQRAQDGGEPVAEQRQHDEADDEPVDGCETAHRRYCKA